ncbi:hypothetical protein E2C01_088628 [Portunus trituberculatus]|uniref:Uncharacterized protein n=1 Tax=Portunus trituberculatus TaxID=210409 RepID=A0A5B7JKD7_PORTR|nr:hypothetical protein [Portunus trituberculatus]
MFRASQGGGGGRDGAAQPLMGPAASREMSPGALAAAGGGGAWRGSIRAPPPGIRSGVTNGEAEGGAEAQGSRVSLVAACGAGGTHPHSAKHPRTHHPPPPLLPNPWLSPLLFSARQRRPTAARHTPPPYAPLPSPQGREAATASDALHQTPHTVQEGPRDRGSINPHTSHCTPGTTHFHTRILKHITIFHPFTRSQTLRGVFA